MSSFAFRFPHTHSFFNHPIQSFSFCPTVDSIADPVNIVSTFPIWKSDVPDPPDYSPCKSDVSDFRGTTFSFVSGFYRTQSFFKPLIHPSDVLTIGTPQISTPPPTQISKDDDQEVIIQSTLGGDTQLPSSSHSRVVSAMKFRDFPFSGYKPFIQSLLRYKSTLSWFSSRDLNPIPVFIRCLIQPFALIPFTYTVSSDKLMLKNSDIAKSYHKHTIPFSSKCPNITTHIDICFACASGHCALYPSRFHHQSSLVRYGWARRRKRRSKLYEEGKSSRTLA
ncbi:hypothetical protein EV363DRAFT_1185210, partial [Boletus edulis]